MSIAFISLSMIFTIVLVIWVYTDADEHGQDGLLWAILVFFLGIPAVIVYVLFFRQGIAPPIRHKAVNRNEDFLIRAKYTSRARRSSANGDSGAKSAPGGPDAGFVDPEVERMIADGRFADARRYVDDMIKIAREMSDRKAEADWRRYTNRIAQAATRPKLRSRTP